MTSNIEITAQLTKMLLEQNQLYLTQAKIQRGQLALTQQLVAAMGDVDVTKLNESLNATTEQIAAADEALKRMGTSGQRAGDQISSSSSQAKINLLATADATEKAANAMEKGAIYGAAFQGAVKGFQVSYSILSGIAGILGSVASTMGQFAMSVLSFPLKIWSFLFEKASQGGGGGELRQTLENIRKEFGDLEKGSSKAIISLAKSISGPLTDTGLSTYRIFGNLAERLKYVAELAKALGPIFINIVQKGLIADAEAVGQFQKALGLSNEQMKTIARTSIVSGRTMDEELRQTANYAVQLGDAFGMNAMEISRDMAEMEGDLKHFGGMSKKEFGEAAVYAKKLGIEIKSLTGIVDTFDNLDSAANAVARLNQQFGIQLETIEIMRMTGPERLEYIRKQYEKTGRTFEQLDRQSQQYMATTIGMTQEEAQLAFAQNNRGVGLDQIKKKSAEAEKKQLTQAEALQKLAGSIERLVKGGGGGVTTLFQAFTKGFETAIFRSRDFRQIMRNIRQILRTTRLAGMQVGRAFVEMFPGVKNILGGLADLFSPTRWKATMRKVVEAFKDFFRDLQTNPEAGLKNLFDRLKKVFFDHFDASTGAGNKIIEGFKTFFTVILKAVVGGLKAFIPMAFEALTKLIKGINSFLKGEVGIPIDTSTIGGQIMDSLKGLWEAIKPAGVELWNAIKNLLSTVFDMIVDWMKEHWAMIGALLIPPLVGSISGAIQAAMTGGVAKGLLGAAGDLAGGGSGASAVKKLIETVTKTAEETKKETLELSPVQKAVQEIKGVIEKLKDVDIGASDIKKAALFGLYVTAGLTIIVLAIVGLAKGIQESGLDAGSILLASTVILAAAGVMAAMSYTADILEKSTVNRNTIKKAGIVAGFAAILTVGFIVSLGLMVGAIKSLGAENVAMAIPALLGMTVVMGAMSLLAYAIEKANVSSKALEGMVVIGAFAAGLTVFMAVMVGIMRIATAGLSAEETVAIGSLFLSMAGVMLAMIPLMLAAAAVGVMMANPIVAAVVTGALVLGLATIGTFAEAVTGVIMKIVSLAEGMPSGPEVKSKVDIMISVMGALTNLVSAVGGITATVAISVDDDDTGAFTSAMDSVTRFIQQMSISAREFITQTITLVSGFSKEDLAKVEVVTSLLAGLGGLIGSFSEALNGLKSESWFGEDAEFRSNMTVFGSMVTTVVDSVLSSRILTQSTALITGFTRGLGGLTEEQVKAIGPLTGVLSSVFTFLGAVMKSLQLDPATVTALAGSEEGAAAARSIVSSYSTTTTTNIIRLLDVVKDSIAPMVNALLSSVAGIETRQLDRAAKAGQAVMSIISGISGFMDAVRKSGLKSTSIGVGEGKAEIIENFDQAQFELILRNMSTVISTVFASGNRGFIKQIVDALVGADLGRLPRNIGDKVKGIVDIVGLVSTLNNPELIKSLSDLSVGGVGGGINPASIGDRIGSIAGIVRTAISGLAGIFTTDIIRSLNVFSKGRSAQLERFSEMSSSLITMVNTLDSQLANVQEALGSLAGRATFGNIKAALFGGEDEASKANSVFGGINSIINELNNIRPVNLEASLGRIAGMVTMGGSEEFNINHKNFTLTVNLSVHLNAQTIEEAIVSNPAGTLVVTREGTKTPGSGRLRGRG